jgi:hypothetical protein
VIDVGATLPAVRVWVGAGRTDAVSLETLVDDGPLLLLFYLFDWSST